MKKRLLITSIVMMLVVAVALSTATYAWFTSNTTVSASTMTLKAATSDKSALAIGWSGETAGTFITSPINQILDPMAPNIYNWSGTDFVEDQPLTNGLTTYELTSENQKFYTSDIKQEGSMIQFSNTGAKVNPVVYTKNANDAVKDTMSTGGKNSFYIINMSTANVLDKVVVSGIFTEYDNAGERYIIAKTDVAPTEGTDYYTKNINGQYVLIEDVIETPTNNPATDYRTNLQVNGFDNQVTYYIKQSLFVETSDTVVKEDTQYFTRTGSGTNESPYNYSKAENLTIGNSITAGTLFEKRNENGDDMLRIAIFTKDYRYTKDTTPESGKKYYKINKDTGVLTEYTTTSSPAVSANPYSGKFLEIPDRALTEDTTVANGKTYYTWNATNGYQVVDSLDGNPKALGYYEDITDALVGKHVLLGVLGQNNTMFTKATSYDMNEVYYKLKFTAVSSMDESKFTTDGTLYTETDDVYSVVTSGSYNDQTTYYTITEKTQVAIANATAFATDAEGYAEGYYTAKNTVVNGKITINKDVNDMYYYNDVTQTLDLAVDLQPGEFVDIVAVVWLDGTVLDDTRSDEYAQVSLKFDSVRDQHQSNPAH